MEIIHLFPNQDERFWHTHQHLISLLLASCYRISCYCYNKQLPLFLSILTSSNFSAISNLPPSCIVLRPSFGQYGNGDWQTEAGGALAYHRRRGPRDLTPIHHAFPNQCLAIVDKHHFQQKKFDRSVFCTPYSISDSVRTAPARATRLSAYTHIGPSTSVNPKTRVFRNRGKSRTLLHQVTWSSTSWQMVANDAIFLELATLEWHTISPDELFRRLSTEATRGLSDEQVNRRLTEYGRNTPSPAPTHHFKRIFGYFFKGFGSVLLIGSILVFVSWKPLGRPPTTANLALAIVLLAVFVIQASFNAWQDWSSSKVMASITTMLPDHALLTRDGAQITTLASDIVPGDVLLLKAGNKLPADVRFVDISSDAKFDRSILTGMITMSSAYRSTFSDRHEQGNPYHFQAMWIRQMTIISRHGVSACRALIAFLAAESVS